MNFPEVTSETISQVKWREFVEFPFSHHFPDQMQNFRFSRAHLFSIGYGLRIEIPFCRSEKKKNLMGRELKIEFY